MTTQNKDTRRVNIKVEKDGAAAEAGNKAGQNNAFTSEKNAERIIGASRKRGDEVQASISEGRGVSVTGPMNIAREVGSSNGGSR